METQGLIDRGSKLGLKALFKSVKPPSLDVSSQIPLYQWKDYYSNLFQSHAAPLFSPLPMVSTESAANLLNSFSSDEILKALEEQHSNAPGLNSVSPVDLKKLSAVLVPFLLKVYNAVLTENICFPSEWLSSVFFFLHKKGSTKDPSNFRSLAIENPLAKIFTWLINRRLCTYAEESGILPDYQFGFRSSRSAQSAVYLLQECVRQSFAKARNVFTSFVDFRKAFDLVDRQILFTKLQQIGIPISFCRIIFNLLSDLKFKVRSNDCLSESFQSFNGVPQGDPLSPILFSLLIQDLPERLSHIGVPCGGDVIKCILYADDLVILTNSPSELQKALDSLFSYCQLNNLEVNSNKTKCLLFSRGAARHVNFTFNGQELENCSEFKYLGVVLTPRLSSSKHVDQLLSKCNSTIAQLFFRLPIQNLPLPVALSIFRTYVLPIIEYGLPCWLPKLSASSSTRLDTIFTKFLKRFLGVPYSTHNSLVYFVTNTLPLSEHLKIVHLNRFSKLNFPTCLSGLKLIPPEPHSSSPSREFILSNIPSHFWLSPVISDIPTLLIPKRALLYDAFDLFHFLLCNRKGFHTASSVDHNCLCKLCGMTALHFHHRICPLLQNLSLCAVMKLLSIESDPS